MKTSKHKRNWMRDATLLAGFLATFFLDLTGLVAHQWLGVAIGLLAGYHFLSHWNWVKSVTLRLTGQTSRQARRYYVLDAGLMLGCAVILVTGLVVSSWLALPLENYAAWSNVHVAASIITLLIVVVKLGLHWRWIVKTAQQLFSVPDAPATNALPLQPVTASARMDRRSFLILMGAVSIPAVLAISRVLDGEQAALATASNQVQATLDSGSGSSLSQASQTLPTTSAKASSAVCTIRCNKGCSYPGRCRRYVDTNKNSRCDMGECM
jgi:hypothetical protein